MAKRGKIVERVDENTGEIFYTGELLFSRYQGPITLERVESSNRDAPKFRIKNPRIQNQDYAEIGAVWEKTPRNGGDKFLDLKLEDAMFGPYAVWLKAFRVKGSEGEWDIVWNARQSNSDQRAA